MVSGSVSVVSVSVVSVSVVGVSVVSVIITFTILTTTTTTTTELVRRDEEHQSALKDIRKEMLYRGNRFVEVLHAFQLASG